MRKILLAILMVGLLVQPSSAQMVIGSGVVNYGLVATSFDADGHLDSYAAGWANTLAGNGSLYPIASDINAENVIAIINDGSTQHCDRYFIFKDTQSLIDPSYKIRKAIVWNLVDSVVGSTDVTSQLYTDTGTNNTININDWTHYGVPISNVVTNTVGSSLVWNWYILNAAGLNAISRNGYTRFMLRNKYYDIDANTPPTSSTKGINVYSRIVSNPDYRPGMTVWWTNDGTENFTFDANTAFWYNFPSNSLDSSSLLGPTTLVKFQGTNIFGTNSIKFDGSTDYYVADTAFPSTLPGLHSGTTTAMTYCFRIQPGSLSAGGMIVDLYDGGMTTQPWSASTNGAGKVLFYVKNASGTGATCISNAAQTSTSIFYSYACVWDGANLKIYSDVASPGNGLALDNVSSPALTGNMLQVASSAYLWLGGWWTSFLMPNNTYLKDILCLNRALNTTEMNSWYLYTGDNSAHP